MKTLKIHLLEVSIIRECLIERTKGRLHINYPHLSSTSIFSCEMDVWRKGGGILRLNFGIWLFITSPNNILIRVCKVTVDRSNRPLILNDSLEYEIWIYDWTCLVWYVGERRWMCIELWCFKVWVKTWSDQPGANETSLRMFEHALNEVRHCTWVAWSNEEKQTSREGGKQCARSSMIGARSSIVHGSNQ